MRIPTLLQKIAELADQPDRRSTIDVDLMLDYTRVLYADLLEWRGRLANPGRQPLPPAPPTTGATAKPAAAPVAPPTPPAAPKPAATAATVASPAKPTATTTTLPDPVPQSKPVVSTPVPPATPVVPAVPITPIHEPTLAELAAAMDKSGEEEEEDENSTPLSAKRPVPQPARQEAKPAANPAAMTSFSAAQETETAHPKLQTPKPSPPRDIRSFISINEKYQIMSELFGNDKGAYEEALNHINTSESEAAALKWLQERLWVTEERSDAVQYFFDLVRRFKSHPEQGFLGFRD